MKIAINSCWGGFSLSHKAFLKLREMKNKYALEEPDYGEFYKDGSGPVERSFIDGVGSFLRDIPRDNADLIKVVEELKEDASGQYADLKIVEIPDGTEWEVSDYDGMETVEEKHKTWR